MSEPIGEAPGSADDPSGEARKQVVNDLYTTSLAPLIVEASRWLRLHDAQDVVHGVIEEVNRGWHLRLFAAKRDALGTAVMNRVRNAARKLRERQKRRDSKLSQLACADRDDGADTCTDPVKEFERAEQQRVLHEAIAKLPRRQRQVSELKIHEEFTTAEIADQLGITEKNVRDAWGDARSKLAEALARGGYGGKE